MARQEPPLQPPISPQSSAAGLPLQDDQTMPTTASSPPAVGVPLAGDLPQALNGGTSVPPSAIPGGMAALPDDATDTDLIEKEWVVKAKDIIVHTQNNPYEQQKAMSHFKADYMKKRYNKDIKLEDD